MFKKLLQLKTLLVALLVMTGAGNVWADEVTYTFTTKDWGATPANWTSGNDGAQLTKGQGIQVTTGASGANGTSPVSYSNISKIVVKYCTNANKGAGTIKVKVGDGTEKSFTVSKPSSGGTTLKDATFNFSPVETGKVKVTVNCTANSVYIHSVTITYSSGSTTETCATPTFSPAEGIYTSAQNVTLSTTTDGATIYYTTDGTDPETSSSSYSSAIPVSATTTIKAIAVKEGMDNSDVASATYTIVSLAHAGTEEDPYTVADARTAIDANVGKTDVYAKGIVSAIVTAYSSEYNNITFDIVDENGTATLRAYRCIGTEAANVQVGDIVVVFGNLTTYNDIYEFAAGNQLISLDRKEAAVLKSIALSGTYLTTFTEGAAFSHEGMTVTATYSDESTTDVTNDAIFSGYDMETPGNQTVTVSYTEGDVTKTATYEITVNAAPSHNVTWSVNGETTVVPYNEGANIIFPANPAGIKGKTFVGWVTDAIAGTTDTAPSFVTSATMGKSDVTYYAVFADEIPGTISNESMTIDANTTNVPTTYGNANTFSDYSLNGVQFKIQQMYKNGEKLQWRASGNSSGTGTMYNEDNLQSIQSIVLYYASGDNNKNFTVNVGDTENPTSGTSITPSISNSTYTFNCSPYNKGYFVLTNGSGAGYLTSIVINYRVNSPSTFSAYCTSVIEAPTASVAACEFDTPFDVTITSETGTTLKYTTDGTDPAEGTAVATNSVVLSIPAETTRVRAIALLNGASSPELDVTYTYNSKQAPTLTVPASVDLKVNETGKTITVTTNSDGAVTFVSSDDDHLLVDNSNDNKVGELLAVAEGTYTVTVTVAETANYRSATADVTVNVTKTATTLTIDATGLTNTDVYVNTAAGALAATVQQKEGGKPVEGATVTSWASSNTDVATIAADGTVTLVAAGTTILTATYAGDDTYEGSTDTYELTVTDSEPKTYYKVTDAGQLGDGNKIAIVSEGEDHNVAMSTTQKTNNRGETEITIENDSFERTNEVQVITLKLLDKNWRLYTGSGYLYAASSSSNQLKTQDSANDENSIVSIAITEGNASMVFQGNNKRNTLQYNSSDHLFACYGSASQESIQIYRQELPLSVSAAGYATFSSTSALDFTKVEDIYAYTATVNGNTISFKRVKKVPAKTGLLLRSVNVNGDPVSTRVPLYDGATYDVTDNAFVAATTEIASLATTEGDYTNYILNKPSGGSIGFYQANGQKVGAGKAYLRVSSKQATRAYIAFSFDDPETGVAQVETLPQQGVAYDLQGRRVNSPKGGLYIINGKKVIVK